MSGHLWKDVNDWNENGGGIENASDLRGRPRNHSLPTRPHSNGWRVSAQRGGGGGEWWWWWRRGVVPYVAL